MANPILQFSSEITQNNYVLKATACSLGQLSFRPKLYEEVYYFMVRPDDVDESK